MSFKYERFLVEAVERCDLRKIASCVKHGHNIHIQNNLGQNLLIHLLKQQNYYEPQFEQKRLKVFQYLIVDCKLGIHIVDYFNKNLFNWATNLNCTQEALYLLNTYPGELDLFRRDSSGSCSLHYAIEHGNDILVHNIVNYFVRYRIRFDLKDGYNNTPEELAKKLGYTTLANFLSEASQKTIYISREIPFLQHRSTSNRLKTTATNKTKASETARLKTTTTLNTNTNMTSLSSYESTSVFVLRSDELYNFIESKVELAKYLNDWQTVAALRTYTKHLNGKNLHLLPTPTLRKLAKPIPTSSVRPSPHCAPIQSQSSLGPPEQMLHLLEPQISSSYRIAFVPICQKPVVPLVPRMGPPPSSMRKMSVASSRRMSSVMSTRKRDSTIFQSNISVGRESVSRVSVASVYKQPKHGVVS